MNRQRWFSLSFACVVIALALEFAIPASSYLNELTRSGATAVPSRWDFQAFPVTWNLNPASGSNITGSQTVTSIMQAAFNTWTTAPNATLLATRGADSSVSAESSSPSNINLVCFVCTDADFAKDSEALAVTITTTANAAGESDGHGGMTQFAGQIIKADIIFNTTPKYSTDGTGAAGAQDLQTVATHEVGHFFGLDHSGVVGAVMFPFAANLKPTLSYDDVAGISTVYPKSAPDVATGTISGTVQMANSGAAIFGAHVYAESISSALAFPSTIRKSPIGTLTSPGGNYSIQGVPPDSYVVTAEPLDSPVANGDVSGYGPAFGLGTVQTSFTTRWH
ncbi:MAG TPA: matrixin family metalloprotease [Candidatus Angelobacter sp.]|nr:matrixin family metalloprotease [Candidatus Angelobacter sp.]